MHTRIWNAIYSENCILDDDMTDMFYKERVFCRLLSGLHSSTTLSMRGVGGILINKDGKRYVSL